MMLSIVIPVLAESELLQRAVPQTIQAASEITPDFELIIASDGSDCVEVAETFAKTDTRIVHCHSDTRRGKGKAISDAVALARGDIFCFYDVDLSTDLRHLKELVAALTSESYDIVIGTRIHTGAEVKRSTLREVVSRAYISYVRHTLKISVSDFQCGFKGFKTGVLRALIGKSQETGWTWDTEIVAHALHDGYRILELPVIWKQGTQSNVRAKDAVSMAKSVKQIRKRMDKS